VDHNTKQDQSFKNEYALEDFEKERTPIQLRWSQKRTSELAKKDIEVDETEFA
jgi:hypothetical protein